MASLASFSSLSPLHATAMSLRSVISSNLSVFRSSKRLIKSPLSHFVAQPLSTAHRRYQHSFSTQKADAVEQYIAASPKVESPVMGIVANVTGDIIIVQSLKNATPFSLVLFQNGSTGLVIDLHKDGGVRIALVSGAPPAPRDTVIVVAVESSHSSSSSSLTGPFSLSCFESGCGAGYIGRVVDALGQPLDGMGPILSNSSLSSSSSAAMTMFATPSSRIRRKNIPVISSSLQVPGIMDRTKAIATIPTGFKAIDAFSPLLRGHTGILLGERGVGKTRVAIEILAHLARYNTALGISADAAAMRTAERTAGSSPPSSYHPFSSRPPPPSPHPIALIYVAIGPSTGTIKDIVRTLQQTGAMPYTVVVAAPSSSSRMGAQFLAPFTGAAIGEMFRDHGKHALVIYDDLTAHFSAARRISGVSWAKTGTAPTFHGALFERSAQMKDSVTTSAVAGPNVFNYYINGSSYANNVVGGSLTSLALFDTPSASKDSNRSSSASAGGAASQTGAREMIQNATSYADVVIELKPPSFVSQHTIMPTSSSSSSSLSSSSTYSTANDMDSSSSFPNSQSLLPVDFALLGGKCATHAAQGEALRYYATRTREVMSELRGTAARASAAAALGIEHEGDVDAALDLHAKTRALLCPTMNVVRAAIEANSAIRPEEVAKLGLEGLEFPIPNTVKHDSSSDTTITHEDREKLSRQQQQLQQQQQQQQLRLKNETVLPQQHQQPFSGTRSFSTMARNNTTNNDDGDDDNHKKTKNGATATDSEKHMPEGIDRKEDRILKKMDPAQIQALLAISQRRQRKSAPALAAAANFAGPSMISSNNNNNNNNNNSILSKRIRDPPTTSPAREAEEVKLVKESKDEVSDANSPLLSVNKTALPSSSAWSGLYGAKKNKNSVSNVAASSSLFGGSPLVWTENDESLGGNGKKSYSTLIHRRQFTSSAFVLTEAKSTNSGSSNDTKHNRIDHEDKQVSTTPSRSFRAPTERTPPVQIFSDMFNTATRRRTNSQNQQQVHEEQQEEPNVVATSRVHTLQPPALCGSSSESGLSPRLLPMWHDAPHQGDAGRLLICLFVLTHGYVQRIPLHRIFEYEVGLYGLVAALPAPRDTMQIGADHEKQPSEHHDVVVDDDSDDEKKNWSDRSGKQVQQQQQQQRGIMRIPLSSTTAGYFTLLDAVLNAPVPHTEMIDVAREDVHTSLVTMTREYIHLARQEADARDTIRRASLLSHQQEEMGKQKQAALSQKTKDASGGWISWLSGKSPRSPSVTLVSPSPSGTKVESMTATRISSPKPLPLRASSLIHLDRLNMGWSSSTSTENIADLPAEWKVLHIVVQEYTRRFLVAV